MHILLGLLSAVGILIFILWRVSMAIHAARDIADAANDARGFFRRRKWRKKVNVDLLNQIDDPREAAITMMVGVAEADGAITHAEQNKIQEIIIQEFGATPKQAEELFARARWLSKDNVDLGNFLSRLKPVIIDNCTHEQKLELIDMLTSVANVEEDIAPDVLHSLSLLKRDLVRT